LNLTIHPEAAKNCNKKAEDLLQRLQSAPERFSRKRGPSNPNIHSTHTFTSKNIIGEMGFGWSDFRGNTVAKAFQQGNELVGLFEDDHIQLIRVAEAIHKSLRPPVVTVQLLTNLVFDWIKEAHRKTIEVSMTDYVLHESEKRITEAEIWIPISHFFIPHPFVFGRITFRAITKAMMDEWETSALAKCTTDEERTSVKTGMERRRRKFQALATATMKIEAEPDRAYEIAYEETDKTVSLLRFFSPAMLDPLKTSYSAPLGRQHEDGYDYLLVKDTKIVGHNAGLTDKSSPVWNFAVEDQQTFAPELQVLHGLLLADKVTDFQEMVIDGLTIFSRSFLAKEISDKLIYMLVALESVFLKDTGEFIQDAISLRIAYMQNVSVAERKQIIADVKAVYKLRSRFVHHGQRVSVDESELLTRFQRHALLSLMALIPIAASTISKTDFFDELENRRLSG
jgi:hypothetical protein